MGFFDYLNSPELTNALLSMSGNPDAGYGPGGMTAAPPPVQQRGIGSDYAGSQSDNQPSTFSRILGSLGITPEAISTLATGTPPQSQAPAPRPGGIGSDANAPAPQPPLNLTGGINGQGYAGQPVPQYMGPTPTDAFGSTGPGAPPQTAQIAAAPAAIPSALRPGGVGSDANTPTMVRGGAGNMPVPTFGIPGGQTGAAPAPLPPGAAPGAPPGAPMNILPPAAQPQPVSGLKALITGGRPSGTLGLQQTLAGIGKGAANIQGNGRFASFARGMGQGIEGAQTKEDDQMKLATMDFNNHIKLLATGSAVERNAALAHLYQTRGQYLQSGKGSNAWQSSDYGRAVMADKSADAHYQRELISLDKGRSQMSPDEYNKAKQEIKAETETMRQALYKRYGLDVNKQPSGYSMENPIDTGKFKHKLGTPEGDAEFNSNVPPGAFFKTPDGMTRMRPPTQEQAPSAAATPQYDETAAATG